MLYSPAQCDDSQAQTAGWLLAQGLTAGDRIALDGASTAEVYQLVIGALRVGIIPVMINPALLAHERRTILDDADAQRFMTTADIESANRFGRRAELAPWPLARPMLYTSGTTGQPKGVWSGVLSEQRAERLWGEEIEVWNLTAQDRYVQIGPLYHSAPLRFAACTQLAGGSVAFPGGFDAHRTAKAIAEHRATFGFAAPVHMSRMIAADPGALTSFRLLAHAGAACPEPLKRSMIDVLGRDAVWEFYGSTEGQFTVCSPDDYVAAPHSVGKARPHRSIRVADDGVIWCAAPSWARFSYWRDPQRTAAAWDGDEFTVGDLGRVDADGFVYLDGRRGDLIITGGVNVYPLEVEKALADVDEISDVAVFAIDDAEWGQAVCAAVVSDADERCWREAATHRLAPYKRPKRWFRVDAIPTTSTGKVRRERLAEDLGIVEANGNP